MASATFDVDLIIANQASILSQLERLEESIPKVFENAGKKAGELFNNGANDGLSKFKDSLTRIGEIALGISFANMFEGFASSAKGAFTSALDMATGMEQTRVQMDLLTGSTQITSELLNNLSAFALATPFELPQLQKLSSQLIAVGFSANQVLPELRALGNLSKDADVLNRMVVNMGQVRAANRLMTKDLNQFSEAGIPLLDALAKKFGVTTSAVRDMAEKGQISFKDTQDTLFALSTGTGRFAGMMTAQSKTFGGVMSNISDGFSVLKRAMLGVNEDLTVQAGGVFDNIRKAAGQAMIVLMNFTALVKGKIDLNEFLRLAGVTENGRASIFRLISAVQTFGNIVKTIGGAIVTGLTSPLGQAIIVAANFVIGFNRVKAVITGSIAAVRALGIAVMGVGTPLLVVAAAVGLFYLAWQTNFGGIRETANGFLNAIVPQLIGFATFINQNSRNIAIGAVNGVNTMIGAWNSLMSYLVGPVVGTLTAFATSAVLIIGSVGAGFLKAGQFIFKNFGGSIKSTVKTGISSLKSLGNFAIDFGGGILQVFGGIGNFMTGAFLGDVDTMASGMIDIISGIVGVVAAVADGIVNVVISAINSAIGMINSLLNNPLVQKGLEMVGFGGAQIGLVGSSNMAGAMSGLGAGIRSDLGTTNKGYSEQGQQDFKKQFGSALDDFGNNLDTDKISNELGNAGDLVAGGTLGLVKGMAGFANTMLNNPPQLPKLQADMVDGLDSAIGNMSQSMIGGLGQVGKIELGAIQNPLDAFSGLFGKGKEKRGELVAYENPNGVNIDNTINQQQDEFYNDGGNYDKDPGKEKKSKGGGRNKSASKGIKEAADELKLKNEELDLQKKTIDQQLKDKKDIGQEEINTLETQKKQLENAEKLKQINQDDLKTNNQKSDSIEDQIKSLQRQKLISTDKNVDRALDLKISDLRTQLDIVKDQEKAEYEKLKKERDQEKTNYQKQLFEIDNQIDTKKTTLKKELDKIQDQKDSLSIDKIQLAQDKYLNDAKKYEIKYKVDYPEINSSSSNQPTTNIQNNNSRNITNNNFVQNKFMPGFVI